MAICLSGDIDKDEAITIIDENFSAWKPKKLPKLKKWREKPLNGIERVTVQYPGEEYVMLAFRTAPQESKDADALRLLDMSLSNASAGLIDLNLVQQQKVRGAGSFPYLQNDYGAQVLFGIPKDGQSLEEVEKLLLEQVDIVKSGKLEDWVVPAIVTDFKNAERRPRIRRGARGVFADSYIAHENWDHAPASWIAWRSDQARHQRRQEIFGANRRRPVDGQRRAENRETEIDQVQIDQPRIAVCEKCPRHARHAVAASLSRSVEDYAITDDPNGVRFYYTHNPLNDLFAELRSTSAPITTTACRGALN